MSRSEWTIGAWTGSPIVKLIASVKLKSKARQHVSYFLIVGNDDRIEIDSRDARILVSAKMAEHSFSAISDDDDDDDVGFDDDDDEEKMLTPIE